MADTLSIGTSALTSLQRAISTTGHNIANVNTAGYSRQTVNFVTNTPEYNGVGALGTGATIGSIDRAYDRFLTADVQSKTSSSTYFDVYAQTAGRVDELLADPATSIASAMDDFFASMEAVANSPTSLPERQVMLSEAETLAQRFHYIDSRLDEFTDELNSRIDSAVLEINQIADSIASLNEDIVSISARGNGSPNDLMDQRDLLVTQLSSLVKTSTQEQSDGSVSVFIGRGQPLVVGSRTETLRSESDPLQDNINTIYMTSGGGAEGDVTSFLSGGELGAAIDASTNLISGARQELGLLAVGLSLTFNEQHRAGDNLTGATGLNFFTELTPAVTPSDDNVGGSTVSANIVDPAALTGDSYRLTYSGSVARLTNTTTGDSQDLTGSPVTIDGVEITFTVPTGAQNGDEWLVEPTNQGAKLISLAVDDPSDIAAAENGAPVGNNDNMLALIALREAKTMRGDTASYNDVYNGTVTDVAVQTRRARSSAETETALLNSSLERQSGLQGVNLDEEAANLIRYQQAYQAAAQVISTAKNVFDVLLQATSR